MTGKIFWGAVNSIFGWSIKNQFCPHNSPQSLASRPVAFLRRRASGSVGGCGVVYMAEPDQPVQRKVALKIIKLGMDTMQVIARFEAERQALALMNHPDIAKG